MTRPTDRDIDGQINLIELALRHIRDKKACSDLIKFSKELFFDVNMTGGSDSLLCNAIERSHFYWIKLFFMMGINPYQPIRYKGINMTPFQRAEKCKNLYPPDSEKVLDFFKTYTKGDVFPYPRTDGYFEAQKRFEQAVKNNDIKIVNELLEQGYPYNSIEDPNLLFWSIRAGSFDMVERLVRAGAFIPPNAKTEKEEIFLKNNEKLGVYQAINELFKLTKQKQRDILAAFAHAPGTNAEEKYTAAENTIQEIQTQFDEAVKALKLKHKITLDTPVKPIDQKGQEKLAYFIERINEHLDKMPKKSVFFFESIHNKTKKALREELKEATSLAFVQKALERYYYSISTKGGLVSQRHKKGFDQFISAFASQKKGIEGINELSIDSLPERDFHVPSH